MLCTTGELSGQGGGCAETLLRATEIFRLSFLAAYAVHSYMSYVLCQVVLCWVIGGNCLVCPCSAAVVTAGDSSTLRFPVGSHRFKSAADWGWANRPNCHESPNILTRNIHTLTDKQYTEQGCRVTAPTQTHSPHR